MGKEVGLVILFIAFPIVMILLLAGVGIKILAVLGISAALGFLLNCFKE